jgi:hypothetical protein
MTQRTIKITPEIRMLLNIAENIHASTDEYGPLSLNYSENIGDLRETKMQSLIIANAFSIRPYNLKTFNTKRCKPSLKEGEMVTLRANADIMIEALRTGRCNLPLENENTVNPLRDIATSILDGTYRNAEGNPVLPLDYLLNCYRKNHVGHEELARGYIYAFCCQSSATCKGVQPSATGDKGSGKTHSAESTVYLFPQEYVWKSTFSDQALYYAPPLQGSMIFIDEKISDPLVDLLKRMMSNFQRETERTVVIDKEPKVLTIPKRQVVITASVHGSGDDQFADRSVQLGILNSKDDDKAYAEFEGLRRSEGRPEFTLDDEILICREMTLLIRKKEFFVECPQFEFAYYKDRRLINIFFDLLEASAILNYMQREHTIEGNVVHVIPNQSDVFAASDFEMFRYANEKIDVRLTKSQQSLHEKIQNSFKEGVDWKLMTEAEITILYGKSQTAVRKLLYGDGGNAQNVVGGLIQATNNYIADRDTDTNQNIIKITKSARCIRNSFAIIKVQDT